MNIIAWTLLVLCTITVFGSPFMIGKDREPYTGSSYVINLATCLMIIALVGRVLGWW